MSTAATVILVVVLVVVLIAAGWFLVRQARSRRLRDRFGSEYDRHLENTQKRRVAERELTEREKRHAKLSLRPLSDTARTHYAEQWTRVQEHFVDAPAEAVAGAEDLVHLVMRERGYPMEGFDQQAADLSVEHGDVVDGYRAAHEIRGRQATTEELRTALVHYRTTFRELLGHGDRVPVQRDGQAVDRGDREARHA
ncbi:hypothetical protein [Actinophytocola sp. NPDC049390]|uniref:hypothetical protein n=1 Tax=Actinophytocola sp. NPDC049390 TaxID=3363894 RepID=UPI00378BF748